MRSPSRKWAVSPDFVPIANGFEAISATCAPPPGPTRPTKPDLSGTDDANDDRLAAIARAEYASRRRREALFTKSLFADPAWDMLLDLYVQRHAGRPISIHSLCVASSVPQTTAVRWIGRLEECGMVSRSPCLRDHRVIHVTLTENAVQTMQAYLRGQL
jgi:DNA-binding MarR family transcriptional regulator